MVGFLVGIIVRFDFNPQRPADCLVAYTECGVASASGASMQFHAVSVCLSVGCHFALVSTRSGIEEAAKANDIVVKGCLSGGCLRAVRPPTYRLSGPKDTLRLLSKEHEGHLEEVTGELQSEDRMGGRKSRPVGKDHRIGASETRSSGSEEAIPGSRSNPFNTSAPARSEPASAVEYRSSLVDWHSDLRSAGDAPHFLNLFRFTPRTRYGRSVASRSSRKRSAAEPSRYSVHARKEPSSVTSIMRASARTSVSARSSRTDTASATSRS
jgi:hypothetical protein